MSKLTNKLTARQVDALLRAGKPGKTPDGAGLNLVIRGAAKRWLWRYRLNGRPSAYTIGTAGLMSLAEARVKHRDVAELVSLGIDPVAQRDRTKSDRMALDEALKQATAV